MLMGGGQGKVMIRVEGEHGVEDSTENNVGEALE
jgi:hypothetical protein